MALLDTMFDRATLMFPTTEPALARLLEVTPSAISIFVDSAHSDFFFEGMAHDRFLPGLFQHPKSQG